MKKFCAICLREFDTPDECCPECGSILARQDPNDLSGTTLDGRYRIVDEIGRGGMGIVYRARHTYLQRDVALKVLRGDVLQNSKATRRFLVEARAVSALRSPHAVTVHDFGVADGGRLFFAMELLDGQPLDAELTRGPLPWPRAVDIALQVCSSLEEAHAADIWHRDIKPANIFLTAVRGNRDHIKLLDFGLAHVRNAPGDASLPGSLLGTAAYCSPEQAMGAQVDHRTDIYSLGVVLYEMLTGASPFSGQGSNLLMSHVRDTPPPVHEANPAADIPPALSQVVTQALMKLPSRRPQSVADLAAALRAAAGDHAPPAKPVSPRPSQPAGQPSPPSAPPTPTDKASPRTRRLALLGLLLPLLAAAALFTTWQPGSQADSARDLQAPTAPPHVPDIRAAAVVTPKMPPSRDTFVKAPDVALEPPAAAVEPLPEADTIAAPDILRFGADFFAADLPAPAEIRPAPVAHGPPRPVLTKRSPLRKPTPVKRGTPPESTPPRAFEEHPTYGLIGPKAAAPDDAPSTGSAPTPQDRYGTIPPTSP